MEEFPRISIVIPLYLDGQNFRQCVKACLNLNYPNYEILIVVDETAQLDIQDQLIKIIHTGQRRTGPAEKRDLALTLATGEYLAFLDDDSFPEKDWLLNVRDMFKSQPVAAVCGPGLTPPESSFALRLSGGSFLHSLEAGRIHCGSGERRRHMSMIILLITWS